MNMMQKLILAVALVMALAAVAMAQPPAPVPGQGCSIKSCRRGCGEYRRLNRQPGELQASCNRVMNEYLILRGEGFNRCLIRCGGPMNTSGVSTLICDTPPFVRRFFKPDNPERTSIPCDLGRSYNCFAYGSGPDCVLNPYLGLLPVTQPSG